jgi:hypothetical protein
MNQSLEKIAKYTKKVGNWMVTGNSTETTYRTNLTKQAYSKGSSFIYRDNSMNKDGLAKKTDAMDKTTSTNESMDNLNTIASMNARKSVSQNDRIGTLDFTQISQKRLQEAIIWSEILGKPMCKRRERR